MRVTKFSYPHPVLGHLDDVKGEFGVEFNVELGREKILLHCETKLDNKSISQLIKDKKACIVCDMDCAHTLFRKTIIIKKDKQIIELNAGDLRNTVDVNYYVLALEDIDNYKPEGLNPEYKGVKFKIYKGEILAFDKRNGSSYFIADKTYEQFISASSFMQVVKQEDVEKGPVLYDLDGEKILIRLPLDDFEKYSGIYSDDSFPAVYHAVLALPALMVALRESLADGNEYLQEKLWYKHIFQLKENSQDIKKRIPWEKNYSEILAQAILRLPVNRSLININDHINSLDQQ